mmetsp:Transcript_8342/g.23913  ORF Transcript_8342/g.23913 Transcript_8342/m.23913 type:complete len:246 (+) Transcript_8342:87-824(+)
MRRKKHKSTRRTVRFFKISFGFKEPFKVLADGNFLHTYRLACHGQAPLQEALSKLLGGSVKVFTSRCITAELRKMGEETADTVRLARKTCKGAECPHEGKDCGPAECIMDLIGEENHEHFFVATQDVQLRRQIGEIRAAPRIFLHANGLILEEPSGAQEAAAKEGELAGQGIGEAEREILKDLESDKQASKFRRKRAKGPNPLAVKKKTTEKKGNVKAKTEKKRSRPRRKRSGVSSGTAEPSEGS